MSAQALVGTAGAGRTRVASGTLHRHHGSCRIRPQRAVVAGLALGLDLRGRWVVVAAAKNLLRRALQIIRALSLAACDGLARVGWAIGPAAAWSRLRRSRRAVVSARAAFRNASAGSRAELAIGARSWGGLWGRRYPLGIGPELYTSLLDQDSTSHSYIPRHFLLIKTKRTFIPKLFWAKAVPKK